MTRSKLAELLCVLELDPEEFLRTSDHESLHKAYRNLCQVWHPDRFQQSADLRDKAEERLKQINSAYALLAEYFQQHPQNACSTESPPEIRQPSALHGLWNSASFVVAALLLFLVLSIGLPQPEQELQYRSLSPAPEQTTSPLFLADDSITSIHVDTPPLVAAAQRCDLRSMRRHLAEGAAIDSADYAGISALSWAARVDCRTGAKQLLENGADPALRARNGYSALAWARFHNHHAMAALLARKH